jgi:hypothetical protein
LPKYPGPNPRTISRSLTPLPFESLPGFLLRLAYRLDRSPRRIAALLGLGNRANFQYALLRSMSFDRTEELARLARLAPTEAGDLTLQRFAGNYPPLRAVRTDTNRLGRSATANWAMSASSRFCPQCLRGGGSQVENSFGGAWKLHWHLPISFACVLHEKILERDCPGCNSPLNSSTSSTSLIVNPGITGIHPTQCRNSRTERPDQGNKKSSSSETCGTRLDLTSPGKLTPLPATDLNQILLMQQAINDKLLTREATGATGANQPDYYFTDIITATHLIKFSWPAGRYLVNSEILAALIDAYTESTILAITEDSGERSQSNLIGQKAAPGDPILCGTLILAANNLMGDKKLSSLTERMEPLVFDAYQRAPTHVGTILRQSTVSRNFNKATTRLSYNFRARTRLRKSRHAYHFQPNHIPPFLPQDWIHNFFAELSILSDSSGYLAQSVLRRGVSLQLAHLVTGRNWARCGAMLGMSSTAGSRAYGTLRAKLRNTALWPVFESGVLQVADYLDAQTHLVDFGLRRDTMHNWVMPQQHWVELRDGLRHMTSSRAQLDVRIPTVVVWAEVSQTESWHHPLVLESRRAKEAAPGLSSRVGRYRPDVLVEGTPMSRLRRRLDRYAQQLAEACDQQLPLSALVSRAVEEENSGYTSAQRSLSTVD